VNDLEARIAEWAIGEDAIRAVAIVGSRARSEVPADEWSDLDVVVISEDPGALLDRDDWARALGPLKLTFLEPTALQNGLERRVLYEDGTDVDFSIVPLEVVDAEDAIGVAARGIQILVDKDGELTRRLSDLEQPPPPRPPDQAALRELTSDFLYHSVWAARKLRRGEVFTAKRCSDGYLDWILVRVLEWHARAKDPTVDTWHSGRFLERWASPRAIAELGETYARYDAADVARALFARLEFFRRYAGETADLLGLEYPVEEDEFATALVHELLD
jgi:aminoglycoside 6-adenylyltransferase